MRKSKISKEIISGNESTPKNNESKEKEDSKNIRKEEENKDIYTTPFNSKNNEDISYSKIEMPISYQLTNGRCIRLRNSQRNLYDNISSIKIESKSSDSSNNIIIHKNENISKDTLFSYGKKKYIYPMNFIKHHRKKLMKEEKEYIEDEKESYKKYNLMVNPSYKYNKKFISSPIHKYLPYCKKNDEEYKKNLISYIRNESEMLNNGAKTVSCIFSDYIKNNNNSFAKEKDLAFYLLKKKQKIYSTQKVFAVEKNLFSYCLINGKNKVDYNHPNKFMFYFDNDIGFNFSWQSPLIIANGDDDVETDDEVLNMAEEKCMDDLIEGINTWNKSSRLCRNYLLQKKINNKIVKTPIFHHNVGKEENIEVRGNNNNDDDIFEMNNNISFGKRIK